MNAFSVLNAALDLVPRHGRVVLGGHAVLGIGREPFERLLDLSLRQQQLPGLRVHELHAEARELHQIVGAGIRPMDDPDLRPALIDNLLGQRGQVRHRELALLDQRRQTFNEGLILADLAQHVLVVEEHPDLGVLRDGVDLALVFGRVPQDRDDVSECPGVRFDELLHVHGVAGLGELADPLMGGDVDVRPLVDCERLEDIKRIRVIPRGRTFEDLHLDGLVAASRLQRGIERLGRRHDIAGAQGAGAIGASPQLDDDLLGPSLDGRPKNRNSAHQNGSQSQELSHGTSHGPSWVRSIRSDRLKQRGPDTGEPLPNHDREWSIPPPSPHLPSHPPAPNSLCPTICRQSNGSAT